MRIKPQKATPASPQNSVADLEDAGDAVYFFISLQFSAKIMSNNMFPPRGESWIRTEFVQHPLASYNFSQIPHHLTLQKGLIFTGYWLIFEDVGLKNP